MKKFLIVISGLLSYSAGSAKNDCSNSLYASNKLYETGNFQNAINILKPCVLKSQLAGSEMFDATRLLALCYMNLNKVDSAEIMVQSMLKLRPDYQTFHYVDPRGLTLLINKFIVAQKLDIGVNIGLSANSANVIKNFSPTETPSTYRSKIGYHAGLLAEYHLSNKYSVLAEPNLNTLSYGRVMDDVAGRKTDYSEQITTFELPITGRYYLHLKKWSLLAEAGGQVNAWLNSYADVQSTSLRDGSVLQSSTDTKPYRRSSIYGYHAGIGISKPLNGGTITMRLRYKNFIPNVVLSEKRYDNVDFILSSQYIDSDFRLSSFGWNISYQLPFKYSIKKM